MTVVPHVPVPRHAASRTADRGRRTIRIGLLGLGQVGCGARAADRWRGPGLGMLRTRDHGALVRDPAAPRATLGVADTATPTPCSTRSPTVIVEALGGLEPARTLVLEALARGIPVVTANKSLLAHHGDELLEAAVASPACRCATRPASSPACRFSAPSRDGRTHRRSPPQRHRQRHDQFHPVADG